jgi:uncharacterized protein YjiS (DUF1127 family)
MTQLNQKRHAVDDFAGVMSGTSLMMVDAVAGAISGTSALISDLGALLGNWQSRLDQRRHLLALDDRLLRDIGVERATALAEADKAFWKR